MKLLRTWGHTQRPWGFEVRADFEHEGNTLFSTMTFDKEPTKEEIDAKVISEQARHQHLIDNPPPDPEIVMLVSEEDLKEIIKLVPLKDKDKLPAEFKTYETAKKAIGGQL